MVTGRTVGRVFTTWVTSLDQVDHAVTDEESAARAVENRGAFEAVCGALFLPSPMEAPPGQQCPRCIALLHPRAKESPERIRTRRRWRR